MELASVAEVECRVKCNNNCSGKLEVEFNGTLVPTNHELFPLPGLDDKRLYNITETSDINSTTGVGFIGKRFWFVASRPGRNLVNCTYDNCSNSNCTISYETVIDVEQSTCSVEPSRPPSTIFDCLDRYYNSTSAAPERQSFFLIILSCTLLLVFVH